MKKILTLAILAFSICVSAQTSITCDSILQTSTCAGGNVIISFQTTGTFPWGNNFTAQLSDNWGNWTSPVAIGSTPFTIGGNGIIFAAIPANANFGFLYRVRIVSSNPADTSNDSPNTLIVTQVAQLNQVISNPGDSACPGDTITLYALNFASSYLWSTGDTTASINVTTSGIYSVTTTDALTCESTAYDTIVFDPALCTGIEESLSGPVFSLFPNPAYESVTVQVENWDSDDLYFISDLCGKIICGGRLNSSEQQVDLSAFDSGIYFFQLQSGETTTAKKLIVR